MSAQQQPLDIADAESSSEHYVQLVNYAQGTKLVKIPVERAIVPLKTSHSLKTSLPAFISHGSIQYLDIPEQQQSDSLYWTLYGQLAADATYDRNDEPVKWIQRYIKVLGGIGMHSHRKHNLKEEYSTRITHSGGSVNAIVVQHLKSSLSRENQDRLDDVIDALRDEANADALSGLHTSSSNTSSAHFQVSDGTVDHHLNLTIHVGFLYFNTDQKVENALFWTCDSSVEFYSVSEILTLKKHTANRLRKTIVELVDAQLKRNVDETPLDP